MFGQVGGSRGKKGHTSVLVRFFGLYLCIYIY